MTTRTSLLAIAAAMLAMSIAPALTRATAAANSGQPIRHEFVVIDEGLSNLFRINERDPSKNWLVKMDYPKTRDMQLIGDGKLLIGYLHGYLEYNLADGKLLKKYDRFAREKSAEVSSVRRQPDGTTLIAGVGLAGNKGITVLTLDKNDNIIATQTYEGDYLRLIRQTGQGTYLMACNEELREATPDGRYLKKFPVEGFKHMWKAVRLPNGNTIVSAGYGGFMVELDPSGAIVRKWGGKGQVPDAVNPYFAATFQLLENGNIVLANWQGHGTDHGKSGVQLLEYDKDGKIVWQWSKAGMISSLQGILVLDGLDTALLHDERAGPMRPLPSPAKAQGASCSP